MDLRNFNEQSGYLFILAGVLLAAISAFVPYFDAGMHLMASVLIAGLAPYAVYSVAVVLLRGALTMVAGAALVAVHLWLVVTERFAGEVDYSDGTIYTVPILMAIVLLPLAIASLRRPWDKRVEHTTKDQEVKET